MAAVRNHVLSRLLRRLSGAHSARQVTVCIPVYGASFVADTIESALGQDHPEITIHISVDLSSDGSSDVCRRYAQVPNVTVFRQTSRLGWIGNCNWLLQRVATPFFCILPHDDLLHPTYLRAMVDVLEQNPRAVCAYSRLQSFGDRQEVVSQPSVGGDRMERMLELLDRRHHAVGFRGVCRMPPDGVPLLEDNACQGFAADTVWLMDWVAKGELVQYEEILYEKRYHNRSEHHSWPGRGNRKFDAFWSEHCAQITAHALAVTRNDEERRRILAASARRRRQRI